MTKDAVIGLIAALALCLTPAIAGADVVYNTFADTNPFLYAGGGAVHSGQHPAYQFQVTGNYRLDSMEFGGLLFQGANSVDISLMSDNAGSVGTLLETVRVEPAFTGYLKWEIPMAVSVSRPLLEQGKSYWIAVAPGAADTDVIWCINTDLIMGPVSVYLAGTGWSTPSPTLLGNIRVNGTPVAAEVVPEPSALILALLGGSGAMGGIMLRRKR